MSSEKNEPNSVFISYAQVDLANAKRVCEALQRLNYPTFFDERDLGAGADVLASLEQRIVGASWFVVCVTADVSREDSYVRKEIQYALDEDKRRRQQGRGASLPIVPILFPGGRLPIHINTLRWWTAPENSTVDVLVEILGLALRNGPVQLAAPANSRAIIDYLKDFEAKLLRLLDESVDGFLEVGAKRRPDLAGPTSSAYAHDIRVSPALKMFCPRTSGRAASVGNEFRTVGDAFDYFEGRFLIVGVPGAGKTTTLLALARAAAADRLADPSAPVPIIVQLSKWQARTNVVEWATRGNPSLMHERLLLLLDGLDEMTASIENREAETRSKDGEDPSVALRRDFLSSLQRDYPNGSVIVTCRAKDFETLEMPAPLTGAVELAELTNEQIDTYLRTAGIAGAAVLANEALAALVRRPLMLALVRAAVGDVMTDVKAMRTEYAVFDRFVATRFRHEAARGSLPFSEKETREILGQVSAHRVLAGETYLSVDRDRVREAIGDQAQSFIDFCLRMHLLKGDSGSPMFVHQRLRDFYAVALLLQAFDAGERWAPPWRSKRDYNENEIQRALSSLASFVVDAVRERALEAMRILDQSVTVRSYKRSYTRLFDCLRVLEGIGLPAMAALREISGTESRFSSNAIAAIGNIGGPEAVKVLVSIHTTRRNVDIDSTQLDEPIIGALGNTRAAEAVAPLRSLLNESSRRDRPTVARSLFMLRHVNPSPFYQDVRDDPEDNVRLWAALDAILRRDVIVVPDTERVSARAEVLAALSRRDFHYEVLKSLREIEDPVLLQGVVAALRRELTIARQTPKRSSLLDRIRLIEILTAHPSRDFLSVAEEALSDRASLPAEERSISLFGRSGSVREAALNLLAKLEGSDVRSAVGHGDPEGVLRLGRTFKADPKAELTNAATEILERMPRVAHRGIRSARLSTIASAVCAIGLAATPMWWPAGLMGVVSALMLARFSKPRFGAVFFTGCNIGLDAFKWNLVVPAVGNRKPILIVTINGRDISPAMSGATQLMTIGLATVTATLLSMCFDSSWLWTTIYLVAASFILLRAAVDTTQSGWKAAFFFGSLVGWLLHTRAAATMIFSISAGVVTMLTIAVLAFFFSFSRVSVERSLGTVHQLESLATELRGERRGWKRWLTLVPCNRYLIRCLDWAWPAVAAVVVRNAEIVVLDADDTDPEHSLAVFSACVAEQVPFMAIVHGDTLDSTKLANLRALGIPKECVRKVVVGPGRFGLRRIDDGGARRGQT